MKKQYISAELLVVRLTNNVIATSFSVNGLDSDFKGYGGDAAEGAADAAGRRGFYDWDAGY